MVDRCCSCKQHFRSNTKYSHVIIYTFIIPQRTLWKRIIVQQCLSSNGPTSTILTVDLFHSRTVSCVAMMATTPPHTTLGRDILNNRLMRLRRWNLIHFETTPRCCIVLYAFLPKTHPSAVTPSEILAHKHSSFEQSRLLTTTPFKQYMLISHLELYRETRT